MRSEGSIEVHVGAEDISYCGIAFRIRDTLNYELVYAQLHTSGRWDALQYDPVFHGSNTWQLYHGPGAQQAAEVPKGDWFQLRLDFKDQSAVLQLNDQPPLVIPRLVHSPKKGFIGLWCYKPAYFRDLRIHDECRLELNRHPPEPVVRSPESVITEWFLHGYGRVEGEPNGTINLNRYLPSTVSEAHLTRQFRLEEPSNVEFKFGFSDEIALQVDGEIVFEGDNTFKTSPHWHDQGYVSLDRHLTVSLPSGIHTIDIRLRRTEAFGFGFQLALPKNQCRALPCEYEVMPGL
jgi:hypothetical protein